MEVATLINLLSKHVVESANRDHYLKPEDQMLITTARKVFPRQRSAPNPDAALFCPSAGYDLLTPLIVSLPYCSQFYFYDHMLASSNSRSSELSQSLFTYILQIKRIDTRQDAWYRSSIGLEIELEFFQAPKQIFWVNDDNLNFLKLSKVSLAFYFHRGDSYGEGGSGQFWDSDLLNELISTKMPGTSCLFITDGQPGGLSPQIANRAYTFTAKNEPERTYYLGKM